MSRSLARRSSSLGVAPQNVEIAVHVIGLDRGHRHAPLDPAPQRTLLVEREIVGGIGAQKIDDRGQPVVFRSRDVLSACPEASGPLRRVFDKRFGNLGRRQHEVHRPGHDGAPRHAVIAGLIRVLRDDESAIFLDGLQSKAAVRPGSGKDHADGALAVFLRQRMQQEVERQARAVTRLGCERRRAPSATERYLPGGMT